jgi:hypothetical protein
LNFPLYKSFLDVSFGDLSKKDPGKVANEESPDAVSLNGAYTNHTGGYALPQVEEGLSLFPYPKHQVPCSSPLW